MPKQINKNKTGKTRASFLKTKHCFTPPKSIGYDC